MCRNLLGFFHLWFVFLVFSLLVFFSGCLQTKNPFSCSRCLCCFFTSSRFPSCFSHLFCGVDVTALHICHGRYLNQPCDSSLSSGALCCSLHPSNPLEAQESQGNVRPGRVIISHTTIFLWENNTGYVPALIGICHDIYHS